MARDRITLIERLPVLIAAVGAIVLVVQWADGRMLWLDEEMIAINIRDRTLGQLTGALSLGQAAPYGWLAVQRLIFVVAGGGERALRFLPMLFGVGTLATAVWIGRRWMGAAGAASLAFLCATGQWLAFHALELKHYSADACFALLLPALAVRAVEPRPDGSLHRRRILAWWGAAIVAQWLSNGALFVAPACVMAMLYAAAGKQGSRGALAIAAPGVAWLAAFAANHAITLGPARSSEFLMSYWRTALPPAGAGLAGTLGWLGEQVAPLAVKPAGSGFGLAFWAAAAVGLLAAPGYPAAFRVVFALVPLSAFVWAGARIVPMYERLSLWIVPALYAGIAMSADAAVSALRSARERRSAALAAVGVAAAGFLVALGADVFERGTIYVQLAGFTANHEHDDRGGVGWLARQRRPGDVWITTHNALPAIWWYGGTDPGPVFELELKGADCGSDELGARLRAAGAARALVYLGFGHDTPREFDAALLGRLGSLGGVSGYRRFGDLGHGLVVDLGAAPDGPLSLASLGAPGTDTPVAPAACIAATPAKPW